MRPLASDSIEVTGLDIGELLAALWAGTRPLALYDRGDVTPEFCRAYYEQRRDELGERGITFGVLIDYIANRPLKVCIVERDDRLYILSPMLYDRDAGDGTCQRVVDELRIATPLSAGSPRS